MNGTTLKKILSQEPDRLSSSMGRLFDGVASLLGFKGIQSYEGEAGLFLQNLAETDLGEKKKSISPYPISKTSYKPIINGILNDLKLGISRSEIALKFHLSLVEMVKEVANASGAKKIAFSGGVFQNTLLVDLMIEHCSIDFELFFHKNLSPNDECLSFGQLVIADLLAKSKSRKLSSSYEILLK